MTSDAGHPYTISNRDFLTAPGIEQRSKSLNQARSHTRLVRVLRIALPLLALGVGAFYFHSPRISVSIGDLEASVGSITIDKGKLRMLNPKLEGANDKQGTYTVTAKYAEQEVANPDIIHLIDIKAQINNAKKGWSRLSAPKGIFETKTEMLELIGDIRTAQSGGMTARLTRASIDMKTQTIVSNEPVDVDFLNGTVRSETMTIHTEEKRVIFRNNVRVHIRKRPEKTKAATSQ